MALGLLALAGAARGQEVPLTLADALAAADRQNPELLAARERVLAQEARAEGAHRSRRPRLSLYSGWSLTDDPTAVFANKLSAGEFTQEDFAVDRLNDPGSIAHLATGVSLEAPLDIFGKIGDAAKGQASAGRAATAGAREATLEVRLRVIETYRRAALSRARSKRRSERSRGPAPAKPTSRHASGKALRYGPSCCAPAPGGASARPSWPTRGARPRSRPRGSRGSSGPRRARSSGPSTRPPPRSR